MQKKALVIIDIQNDITKNYKEIIDNVNRSIDWAVENGIHVVYIRHYNLSNGTRTFKPNTRGSELVSDMKLVSKNIFEKSKGNALTSEDFADFIKKNMDSQYIFDHDALKQSARGKEIITDDLFEDVAYFVVQTGNASINSLQKEFEIGFNRAQKLVEMLEEYQIVSPSQGTKAREVLVSINDLKEILGHD